MDTKKLERSLEIWQRILLIDTGAVFTLLATGLADLPNLDRPYFPGWYAVWFIVLLATLLPPFLLLLGRHYLKLPLRLRLRPAFSYFALAWFAFLSIGIRMGRDIPAPYIWFMLVSAAAIGGWYWYLRRRIDKSSHEIFP